MLILDFQQKNKDRFSVYQISKSNHVIHTGFDCEHFKGKAPSGIANKSMPSEDDLLQCLNNYLLMNGEIYHLP